MSKSYLNCVLSLLRIIKLSFLIIIQVCLLFAQSSSAHHSRAEFSGGAGDIEGVLELVIWHNPHPTLNLRTADQKLWRIQVLANVNGLNRSGVSGERFQLGDRVRLMGELSSRREGLLLATSAQFEDGSTVRLAPDESSGVAVYSDTQAPTEIVLTEQEKAPSFFRVWTVLERVRNKLPLQDHAQAVKDAWDPLDNDVQYNCSPLGMPGAMMSPHPIQISQHGDDIIIRLEEHDRVRTIHMSDAQTDDSIATSPMGYSTGHWEQSTLVINTSRINYPHLDEYGTIQSDLVEIKETFTLSEDGQYLDWTATVTDPETLTEPAVVSTTRWQWIPGEALQPYECAEMDDLLGAS